MELLGDNSLSLELNEKNEQNIIIAKNKSIINKLMTLHQIYTIFLWISKNAVHTECVECIQVGRVFVAPILDPVFY